MKERAPLFQLSSISGKVKLVGVVVIHLEPVLPYVVFAIQMQRLGLARWIVGINIEKVAAKE